MTMSKLTISIFENKVFLEILKELNLFQNAEIKFIENYNKDFLNKNLNNNIMIFFLNAKNMGYFSELKTKDLPVLLVNNSLNNFNKFLENQIKAPFKIVDFENKMKVILAKQKFKESSFIKLGNYQINKNERKIERNGRELKLTEKEVNFLIFFESNKSPIKKEFILKNLWNYSTDSDTHTVETHIHRLRKKILKNFNDNNFIKNNDEGYYI